jgi:EmrB/QacA subfamily drug resistance transporter
VSQGTNDKPVNPRAVLLAASGATFMAFLDTTVVNVAFPQLRLSFPAVSLATLTWLVTGYSVLFAALMALAGRLADVTGRRRLFLWSVAGFTVASALSAAAPDFGTLVAARALQGACAAGMIPAALGLVLSTTAPQHRAAAVGAWSAAGSFAAAVGPALSAWLTAEISWRAIFAINIPVGLLVLWRAATSAPRDLPTGQALPDAVGTAAFTVGIAGIVIGLSEGSNWGWSSNSVLVSLVVGVFALAYALLRSRPGAAAEGRIPALELDLYRNRRFALAGLGSGFFAAAMYSWLLTGPLFLTAIWHYSVLKAGLAVTPGALSATLTSLYVGRRATPRIQGIAVLVGALTFCVVCAVMGGLLGEPTKFLEIWLPIGLFGGSAIGAVLTGLSTASATSVPPIRFSVGMGLTLTARQVGGSIGVAATAVLLSRTATDPAQPYLDVFWFGALTAAAAAVVGFALRQTPMAAPAPAASPAAQTVSAGESGS